MHSLVFDALIVSAALHVSAPSWIAFDSKIDANPVTSESTVSSDPASRSAAKSATLDERLAALDPESSSAIPVLKRLAAHRSSTPVPLTVVPPADATVPSGAALDPAVLGSAKVESAGARSVQVTYRDIDLGVTPCATDPIEREVRRVWTATDVSGNTGSSTQMLKVTRRTVSLDVRPGVCPNEYRVGPGGPLPISILGRVDFDVHQIDVGTLRLWTSSCTDGPVVPTQTKIEDNATPYAGTDGGCHASKMDGLPDLSLRFASAEVMNGLHLKSYPKDSVVRLVVTGKLTNGATFIATDSVRLK